MDKLLSQSVNAVASTPHHLHSRYIQDIPQSDLRRLESNIDEIRKRILNLLEQFQIKLPPPSTSSSWILKTNLTSLDIACEDLYPEKMRGYGDMDPSAAANLTSSIEEIRKLLNQSLEFLADVNKTQKKQPP
jgi:hypothetical protein